MLRRSEVRFLMGAQDFVFVFPTIVTRRKDLFLYNNELKIYHLSYSIELLKIMGICTLNWLISKTPQKKKWDREKDLKKIVNREKKKEACSAEVLLERVNFASLWSFVGLGGSCLIRVRVNVEGRGKGKAHPLLSPFSVTVARSLGTNFLLCPAFYSCRYQRGQL